MNFKNPDTATIKDKKLYIFDMDGTIYLGGKPFDFAIRFIKNLRAAGKRVLFYTNNASHTTPFYYKKLERLGFDVLDSKTNFVFARSEKIGGEELYLSLKERGILIRHFSKERIKEFNRITIGRIEDMKTFISAIEEILRSKK